VAAFTSLVTQPTPEYVIHMVTTDDLKIPFRRYVVDTEVTCLALCTIGTRDVLVAAVWQLERTSLLFFDLNAPETEPASPYLISHSGTPVLQSGPPLQWHATQLTKGAVDLGHTGLANDHSALLGAITSLVTVYESVGKTVLVGGTRGGYLLQFEIEPGEQVKVATISCERISRTSLEVSSASSTTMADQGAVFMCCDSTAVLLEDYDVNGVKGFTKRHQVIPVDPGAETAENLRVSFVTMLPEVPSIGRCLVLAGDRLLVAHLEPTLQIVSRRMRIGSTPVRLIYSHVLNCLVVAATVDDKPTLLFVDPDTGRDISRPTDRNRVDSVDYIQGLGHKGDWIHSLFEWVYEKDDKTFSFILVGTNAGRLLVVSAVPIDGKITFWSRHKRSVSDAPVYAVCAEGDSIFFCSGTTVYWDKLDMADRRFKNHATISLVSTATTLSVVGRKLYALTQTQSLEVIDLDLVKSNGALHLVAEGQMEQRVRPATHMLDVGDPTDGSPLWPITLLSDRECGVAGAWVPRKDDGQGIAIMFEAELPASVRRFRRGRTRPPWWQSQTVRPRYGRIPSTLDDAEALGVCLDGSVQHFALVHLSAWRLLRLIQDAAMQQKSDAIRRHETPARKTPLSEPSTSPRSQLHVNGDVLEPVLSKRELEHLFRGTKGFGLFKRYLDELDNGTWTARFGGPSSHQLAVDPTADLYDEADCEDKDDPNIVWDDTARKYFKLGYDVLEYYLSPVL
jgi:hypothetical protein